ncbi:MAG: hypothetical protein IT334_09960 [Thermomicrobiales bacterium]|nr:hypothetical protein [Thermomicrobiales bacterium]
MIVFIHGPDAHLVRQHLKDTLARLDPDGANTSRVDGRTTSPQTIAGMVATPAFFGMARFVVVDDLFARTAKGGDDDDDASGTSSTKANPAAIELLKQVVEPNSLVLVEPSLASVPAAVKKAGVGIEVKSGVAPRGPGLTAWVIEQAELAGSSIDQAAAQALLDAMSPGMWREASRNAAYDVPPDLDAIQQEVIKLATYAYPEPITRAVVQRMTPVSANDQLFPFLSALYSGEYANALKLLADAIDRGEDHFRLIAQIYGQAELATPIEAGRGIRPEEIGKDIGVASAYRMAAIARSLSRNPVAERLPAITAVDRGQKQGELRTTDDVLFALLDTIGSR